MSVRSWYRNSIRTSAALTMAAMIAISLPSVPVFAAERERSTEAWVVQVVGERPDGKMESCAGVIVATRWVLTARHCKSNKIYFDIEGKSSPVPVLKEHSLGTADVKLLKYNPVRSWKTTYPRLASRFAYRAGTIARSYAVQAGKDGRGARQERVDMKVHHVQAVDDADEMSSGAFIRTINAKGGVVNHASGAPLVIGDQIVGIGSRSAELNDSVNAVDYVDIASIRSEIEKIVSLPKVDAEVQDGELVPAVIRGVGRDGHRRLYLQVSTKLLYSYKQPLFWYNGKRIHSSPAGKSEDNWGLPADISLLMFELDSRMRATDLFQVGYADNQVGQAYPQVDTPGEARLIYEDTIEGLVRQDPKELAAPVVTKTHIIDGKLAVSLDSDYVRSGRRIVFWLNKKYVGEVYGDKAAYVGVVPPSGGVSTYRFGQATTGTDVFEVGVVSGVPGNAPGQPEESKLIYSGGAPS